MGQETVHSGLRQGLWLDFSVTLEGGGSKKESWRCKEGVKMKSLGHCAKEFRQQ